MHRNLMLHFRPIDLIFIPSHQTLLNLALIVRINYYLNVSFNDFQQQT